MNTNAVGTFVKFSEYLMKTGFIQRCVKHGMTDYTYGPAGHLLRKNIEDIWWQRMVTKTESCFPVVGKDNDLHRAYHDVLQFVNNTLPFSIAHIASYLKVPESTKFIPKDILPYIDTSTCSNLQISHFCSQSALHQTFDQIADTRLKWWKQYAGNSTKFMKMDAGSKFGNQFFHLKYKFPWGQETIEEIVNKGDEMASEIEEKTGINCMLTGSGGDYLPQCITSTIAIDTAVFVYLDDALNERKDIQDATISKPVLRLHPVVAPFKVAITQHGTKEKQLNEVVMYISRKLRTAGIQTLFFRGTTTPLEEQIDRHDSLGVPFTVVVTDMTLQIGAIQLRNRDTTIQETLGIDKLEDYLLLHLKHQE